jgi:hypothetical protein
VILAPALIGLLLAPDVPPARPRPAATARPAPSRPGLSWAEADSLTRKLAVIEAHHRQQPPPKSARKQTVQVTQGEVNSYLNLSYASELPKGVSDLEIRFGNERIDAKGSVDIEQVKGSVAAPSWSPLALLGGLVPIELSGKLVTTDGFGTIELDSAYVASIRVPISVVEQMVASSTKSEKRPDGFDIHAPFRLPYSVDRVRIEPGKATLEF